MCSSFKFSVCLFVFTMRQTVLYLNLWLCYVIKYSLAFKKIHIKTKMGFCLSIFFNINSAYSIQNI